MRGLLKPVETNSDAGRSLERYRRIAISAASSALAQAVSIGTGVLMVPLALSYLGSERYGLWITLSAVVSMFGFADLGLGNGLLNAVAEADGKDDTELARSYISTAFFMVLALAVALAAVAAGTFAILDIDWANSFGTQSSIARSEVSPTIVVLVACFLVALPVTIVQRVQLGYQLGYVNSLFSSLGSILSLVGVAICVWTGRNLPAIALAVMAAPILAQAINGTVMLRKKPWLAPVIGLVNVERGRQLLRVGMLFFILQLAYAVAYQSDNVVIARILGAEAVTDYAIPLKLFMLAPMALSFVLTPLWPAYREAITRGDVDWVRKTLKRSIAAGLAISLIVGITLVFTGAPIVRFWSNGEVNPSTGLLLGLAVFLLCNSLDAPVAMFLNGMNVIGFQVIRSILMAALNISLSIVLVQSFGVVGAILGTVVAQIACLIIPSAFYVPRLLARLENR